MPGIYVRLLPGDGRKFAARFGEHFGGRIDSGYPRAREGIRKDTREMAGAAAEIINLGVVPFRNAGNEVEARTKADFRIAKVGLRLPGGHGCQKSYHRARFRNEARRESLACDRAARALHGPRLRLYFSCDKDDSLRFVRTRKNGWRFPCWLAPAQSGESAGVRGG